MKKTLVPLLCLCGYLATGQPSKYLPVLDKPGKYFFFPVVVKSPEYKWGLGAAGTVYFRLHHDSTTRTSNFKMAAFYTLRKQMVLASEGNVYFDDEDYILHLILTASHFPDRFWGLGNETPDSAMEKYAISQYDIFPQLMRKTFAHLFVGVGYEFQNVFQFDYDRESGTSLFDKEEIVGRNGGRISGAGILLSWDNRNNSFSPSKGFFVQYYSGAYRYFMGSDFEFNIRNMDIRKYFDLHNDRVFAVQMNIISTKGDVPIRNLTNIGSNSYVRGYYEGRYADKNLWAFQGEFRTPVWKYIGMVMFAGAGRVAGQFNNLFSFHSLKPSLGLGLRVQLNQKEKLNLRVDSGFGKNSKGSYINMGEAF